MPRLRTVLTTLFVGFGAAVLPSAGCQSCAIDCDGQAPLARTIDARVLAVEYGIVTLAPIDDDSFDVLVHGRASALEVGETYTFPIHEEPADVAATDDLGVELPTANLAAGCDCGAPFITHVDGSEVDTSILPDVPLRKYGWGFIAAAMIAVVGWGCLRTLGGQPL